MSDREVVILSGVRTAVADFSGALKDVPPTELAGKVIAAICIWAAPPHLMQDCQSKHRR